MIKTSKAQLKASKKWDSAHKDRKKYIIAKSTAKRFITKLANAEDLKEAEKWIKERKMLHDDD